MREDLADEGTPASLNRVTRLLTKAGPQGWLRRKTRGGPRRPRAIRPEGVRNLLERDFAALEPETKWVADITEIVTDEDKLHLCVVLDLYGKLVMGWSMHQRQDRHMVVRAVQRAVWQREGGESDLAFGSRRAVHQRHLPEVPGQPCLGLQHERGRPLRRQCGLRGLLRDAEAGVAPPVPLPDKRRGAGPCLRLLHAVPQFANAPQSCAA